MWARIQRTRRRRLQAAVALTLTLTVVCAVVIVVRRLPEGQRPVRVSAALDTPPRADGSAPVPAVWRLTFEGAELRVYRNALGMMHRCPGAPGCTDDALALSLDAPGEYRALVFSRPVSGGGFALSEDLAAARARGDSVELSPSLVAY